MDREYVPHDARMLATYGAPLDEPEFKRRYFVLLDIHRRMAPNGELHHTQLELLVYQWQLENPVKAADPKPSKKEKAA